MAYKMSHLKNFKLHDIQYIFLFFRLVIFNLSHNTYPFNMKKKIFSNKIHVLFRQKFYNSIDTFWIL